MANQQYYHNLVTEKSWQILQQLHQNFNFILIGGWAVYLWTLNLKSKDIDIVVDFKGLNDLKKQYEVLKNNRLTKYEIKNGEVDIDIYTEHYSLLGFPPEELKKYTVMKDGYMVPRPEIILVLKYKAFLNRQGTPKGQKDFFDILSLLALPNFDFVFFNTMPFVEKGTQDKLKILLSQQREIIELGWNAYEYSKIKKHILKGLKT